MLVGLWPLLILLPFSAAADGTLFTSSVTYCEPPETLLIQQFDVKYFAKNQSIFFDISAASVVRLSPLFRPFHTHHLFRKLT
jgi:hypothetical protein